jgi:1-acyl-sn-glycerol-3-phosphate acyltransferase
MIKPLRVFFYHLTRSIAHAIPRLGSRTYFDGLENVPRTGPGLIISNHIAHFDPAFMMTGFPRIAHFLADKPLLEIPIYGKMLEWGYVFPIDRNKTDRTALKTALARLAAGHLVAIFPEKGIRHGPTSVLGGAELPIGTASLWKMADVPVIPMIIIGTDQLYSFKNYFPRCRVLIRIGKALPPDKNASREELRDRIVAAWHEIFESMKRDYQIRPDELPQSAQQRWGRPEPAVANASPESPGEP